MSHEQNAEKCDKTVTFSIYLVTTLKNNSSTAAFMYSKVVNCNFMTIATRQNYFMHILLQCYSFLKSHVKCLFQI